MKILREGLEKKFFDMCLNCVESEGYKLYDLEYLKHQKILRLYIMDENTSSAVLDDCIKVDRALSPYFEESDWIPEDIVLEVSSPGLFRKLRSFEHFKESLEMFIKVKFKGEPDGVDAKTLKKISSSKSIVGELKEVQGNEDDFILVLETFYRDEIINLKIKSIDIVKAQCEPDI